MKCTDVYLYICDNLDQKINSPQCREIKRHLQSCPDCSAYLDSVKKTVHLYRTLAIPHIPATAHKKLIKAIDMEWHLPATPGKKTTTKLSRHKRPTGN